jgi:hypothetical protein
MMNHEEAWSPQERAALAAWTAPSPPAGFAAQALARAGVLETGAGLGRETDPRPPVRIAAGPNTPVRGFAAAAVFALLLGGLWSLRGGGNNPGKSPDPTPPASGARALWAVPNDHDAGPRPEAAEVQPPDDGVQATAS